MAYIHIEAQAGFRAAMGTADNIFVLHGIIKHLPNKGKKLFVHSSISRKRLIMWCMI